MKNKNHILILLAVAVLTSTFGLYAQNNNFAIYGIEEGIIQSQIRTIIQDNSGVLWIGTIGGLAKYDGTAFINFTQKDGLAEDWITVAHKDRNGNLWFGHWGGGVSKCNPDKNQFTDIDFYRHSHDKFITSIAEDKNGNLWFGTDGVGVVRYNPSNGKAETYDEKISSNHVSSLYFDLYGRLWIGTDNGITVFDRNPEQTKNTPHILDNSTGLSSNKIHCMIQYQDHELWMGTEEKGIIRVNIQDSNLISLFEKIKHKDPNTLQTLSVEDGLTSDNINTLFEDDDNKIWIGAKNSGIIQFIPAGKNRQEGKIIQGELNVFSNKFEMKYFHAYIFSQDREGNIWIGTDIGLNKYKGDLFKIYNHNENLLNDLVWSVLVDRKDNVWFGTSDGVSRFSFPELNGKVQYNEPIVKNYTVAEGLSENLVIAMHEDADGNIWFGTEGSGVCALMIQTGRIAKYSVSQGLADNKIFTINSDNEGNLWLGTRKGASKLNPHSSIIQNYNKTNGLGGDKVYSIYKDSKGNMWFALLGGNLTKYSNGSFTLYGDKDGLTQRFVTSITEDKNNNMWFGSYQGGVIKYNGEKFITYGVEQGISSNSPNFIICDEDNTIWMGMNLGIEKFDQKEGRFILYGKQQGFIGMETNENAVSKDRYGNIWFGTVKGAVKFDPKKDKPNKIESLTYTKSLNIYLKEAEFPKDGTFSYDQNYLTFHNLGVSLTNPREVRYRYKLDGFEKDWSPPTTENKKTYSNLPHGEYTFQVISSNNDGLWNQHPASYHFIITPPFWKTWWFYGICAFIAISSVVIYIKIRERNLIRQQRILEETVRIRTAQLREKNEEVEKQNKNIKASINYAKRIQQSILVREEEIKKYLPGIFVFYRPRDIVSGDFYWFSRINEKSIIAAVDCTGHGVPGAFMSMIGNTLLNEIVNEKEITDAADILNRMHLGILKSLHATKGEAYSQDGMDMSICVISTNGNSGIQTEQDKSKPEIAGELQFAGAMNPLYLVHDNKLQVIEPDLYTIGGSQLRREKDKKREFTNHAISLQKETGVYLFSDGFIDQFGSDGNIKFNSGRFKQLLIDNYRSDVDYQKGVLENTFDQWKGNTKQIDDVLVVGIKV